MSKLVDIECPFCHKRPITAILDFTGGIINYKCGNSYCNEIISEKDLQVIDSLNKNNRKNIIEEPKSKNKLVKHEKSNVSISKGHKIPDIIIQGIEKSIEISKRCVSEKGKISPKVGAVLIGDNKIVYTAYRGEIEEGDHAEYTLLEKKIKSKDFSNTILITTLEPCTRRSSNKTSCAERIVQAGIRQVWIGILDPNPEISAKGYTYLRMNDVSINFFPNEYAEKIIELNKEFWENETRKYKRDVMVAPDHPRRESILDQNETGEEKKEIPKSLKRVSIKDIDIILGTSHPKDWKYNDSYGIFTYNLDVEMNINIRDDIPDNRNPFEEDWVMNFSDPTAQMLIARVFYRGSFVKENLFVLVDGFKNILPLPKTAVDLRISQFQYNMGRILNFKYSANLEYNLIEYDIKLKIAGIKVSRE